MFPLLRDPFVERIELKLPSLALALFVAPYREPQLQEKPHGAKPNASPNADQKPVVHGYKMLLTNLANARQATKTTANKPIHATQCHHF